MATVFKVFSRWVCGKLEVDKFDEDDNNDDDDDVCVRACVYLGVSVT